MKLQFKSEKIQEELHACGYTPRTFASPAKQIIHVVISHSAADTCLFPQPGHQH